MAFASGTALTVADLFTKLSTFAQANGWVEDTAATPADQLFLHKIGTDDDVYVQFWWDAADPEHVGIYHSLNYGGTVNPGQSGWEDSGNGNTLAGNLSNGSFPDHRHVTLVNSSMRYWFFEDDDYIHVVAETVATSPQEFVHFGMGVLTKSDDWTGGSYVYGWLHTVSGLSPLSDQSSFLLDALLTRENVGLPVYCATLHCEGLVNQNASGKFAIIWGNSGNPPHDDRQSTPVVRETCYGGFRGGPFARPYGDMPSSITDGHIILYPIHVFHKHNTSAYVYHLGEMPDTFGVVITNYDPAQEVVIGGETYLFFPSWKKDTTGDATTFQGIAYKKVT